mgnify:CR=1 FL=1
MSTIAIEIKGELENISPICIGNEFYPRGQDIRGAMGYVFLDMGLKNVSRTFEKDVPHFAYFKDAYVRHNCKDKGRFLPVVQMATGGIGGGKGRYGRDGRNFPDTIYRCDKCLATLRYPTRKDKTIGIHINKTDDLRIEKASSFVIDTIGEGNRFDLDMILNVNPNINKTLNKNNGKDGKNRERIDVENCVAEFISGIKYVSEIGSFNLGKRSRKGLGLMKLKNVEIKKITMDDISRRGDFIYEKIKKDDAKLTIHLLSDTIEKFPITGDDLLRNIKNSIKFFHPHWHEIRDEYRDPKVNLIGKNIEYDERKTTYFLDCKVENRGEGGIEIENQKLNKIDFVISRGTQYSYQLYDVDKISSEFWNGLAMAEMLRGIGDRSSFGKGQFVVS